MKLSDNQDRLFTFATRSRAARNCVQQLLLAEALLRELQGNEFVLNWFRIGCEQKIAHLNSVILDDEVHPEVQIFVPGAPVIRIPTERQLVWDITEFADIPGSLDYMMRRQIRANQCESRGLTAYESLHFSAHNSDAADNSIVVPLLDAVHSATLSFVDHLRGFELHKRHLLSAIESQSIARTASGKKDGRLMRAVQGSAIAHGWRAEKSAEENTTALIKGAERAVTELLGLSVNRLTLSQSPFKVVSRSPELN